MLVYGCMYIIIHCWKSNCCKDIQHLSLYSYIKLMSNTMIQIYWVCFLLAQQQTEAFYLMLFATASYRSCLLYVICYSTIQELSTLYIKRYLTAGSFLDALQYFRCRIDSHIFLRFGFVCSTTIYTQTNEER